MNKLRVTFYLVIILILICTFTGCGGSPIQRDPLQEEFEAKGGIRVTLDPQKENLTEDELNSVKTVLGNRLTSIGFLKRIITFDGSGDIIIDLINDNNKVNLSNVQSEIDFISMKGLLTAQEIDETKFDSQGRYLPTGKIIIDGNEIIEAQVAADTHYYPGKYQITVELNAKGSGDFDQATAILLNKKMGIFMDSTLLASPTVQVRISNGELVIPGGFSNEEASNYCTIIQLGPLPTELINKSIIPVSPKEY